MLFRRRLHPDDTRFLDAVVWRLNGLDTTLNGLRSDITILTKLEATVKQQIQALVAVVGPLVAAVQALETQAVDEKKTIKEFTDKLAAGTDLTDEETQALADAAKKISDLTDSAVQAAAPVSAASTAATQAASG